MEINDKYKITIDGNVINTKTNRLLKTCLVGSGYKSTRLGKGKHYYIHQLVAKRFLPSPTAEGCVVDHIDRNKLNNNASNLRWCSRKVNSLNRTIEHKPRLGNKTGEHHIKCVITKTHTLFLVVFNTNDFKHYSSHSTLEKAVEKRNSLL